jgi:hypothetical protein
MRTRLFFVTGLALVFSARTAPAQPPGPAPTSKAEATPADEAAAVPTVESWYKITHQTRHIGHARLAVSRLAAKEGPVLRLVLESSYLNPENNLPASSRTEADLQASDLSILQYRYSADTTQPPFGRIELLVTCTRKEKTKWTAVHEGPQGRFPTEDLVSEEPLTLEAAFSFLVARRDDLKRNGGAFRARVFNPIHLDKLILDADIEVLPPEKRTYGSADATVTPYRWKRPGLLAQSTVTMTEYITEKGDLQESIQLTSPSPVPFVLIRSASEEESLPEGRRLVKRRGRRDPFDRDKVLTPKAGDVAKTAVATPKDTSAKTTPQEEIVKQLAEATRHVIAAEGQHREFGEMGKVKIRESYDSFLNIVLLLHRNPALTADQRAELDGLRARIERVYPGALVLIDQAKKMLDRSRQILEAQARLPVEKQNYRPVEEMLSEIRGLETSRELSGTAHVATFQKEVLLPVRDLEGRMAARQQFQKIKLEVTGIIYHLLETPWPVDAGARVLGQDLRVTGAVPLFVSKSGAIVNSSAVSEGDVLDPKTGVPAPDIKPEDGVVIQKIRPDEVLFRYKNEDIPVPLKP